MQLTNSDLELYHLQGLVNALKTDNATLNKSLLAKIVECDLLRQRVTELRESNDALERENDKLKAKLLRGPLATWSDEELYTASLRIAAEANRRLAIRFCAWTATVDSFSQLASGIANQEEA